MTEQKLLNMFYPGIKADPSKAFTETEFNRLWQCVLHKAPSEKVHDKAIQLGIIKK